MKKWLLAGAALVAAGLGAGAVLLSPMAEVGAGYVAKVACSEIFVAGRDKDAVLSGEFNGISPALNYLSVKVDESTGEVAASLFGIGKSKAALRNGYGCTLVRGGAPEQLPPLSPITESPLPNATDGFEADAMRAAIDAAFADEKAATRAILVVRDGAVIAERYADGFAADTRFLSWSMAKSVTATMVGVAVRRGLINIEDAAPVDAWGSGDDRAAITWNDLLQMQSGLAFVEDYADTSSDVSKMLFRARDAGAVAANKPLEHAPGSFWSYSSGTTNLIQRTLRETLEANDVGYHAFARDEIFAPIGAASVVIEPDSSGTFVGSSYIYATMRDWAKLGLLYLNDGVVGGVRILPEGWSRYVATPAAASDNFYGAQFWLNRSGADGRPQYVPGVPEDAYMMAGHEGQYVLIVPDKRLVIVRTGMTRGVEPMPVVAPTFAAIYAAVE